MNSNLKNLIYAVLSIVIILPGILLTSDYINYTLPMEKMALWESPEQDKIQDRFQEVSEKKGSTCFRTVTDDYFCYPTPSLHRKELAISWMFSNTTQAYGEIHFDLVKKDCKPDLRTGTCADFYFTLKDIVPMSDGKALVTFADRDFRVGNSTITLYEITDKFEFSRVLEEFDTFIAKCDNPKGTSVTLIQYLGIKEIDDNDYFMTWHFNAEVDDGITCKYPEIIQHSLNYDFKKFGLPTDITMTVTRNSPTEPESTSTNHQDLIDARNKLREIYQINSSLGSFNIKDAIVGYGIGDGFLVVDILEEYYHSDENHKLITQKIIDITGGKVDIEFNPSGAIVPTNIESKENYSIEITGMKDVYIVGEKYDFSYILSGYGHPCGSKTVTFPDSNGVIMTIASSASCIANLPMEMFVFDIQKEQGTTYGHVEIKNPGTYTVTVTFERPNQYFPTTASQEFRVVDTIIQDTICEKLVSVIDGVNPKYECEKP